jgi:hypothetical protein
MMVRLNTAEVQTDAWTASRYGAGPIAIDSERRGCAESRRGVFPAGRGGFLAAIPVAAQAAGEGRIELYDAGG